MLNWDRKEGICCDAFHFAVSDDGRNGSNGNDFAGAKCASGQARVHQKRVESEPILPVLIRISLVHLLKEASFREDVFSQTLRHIIVIACIQMFFDNDLCTQDHEPKTLTALVLGS